MPGSIRLTNKNRPILPLPRGRGLTLAFCALSLAIFGWAPAIQADCLQGCSPPGPAGASTYFGDDALVANMGAGNSAFGASALSRNTTGYVDTAVGEFALFLNTTGIANTAVGSGALQENQTGFRNTATGQSALQDNLASNNTADGYNALFFNTNGSNNTAVGSSAMGGNPDIQMTGSNNTAVGYFSGLNDTTGSGNTAGGANALSANKTGSNNTAIGFNALTANSKGSANIALGNSAGNLTTGSNNIDLGNAGVAAESNTIRIGATDTQTAAFIAGIRTAPLSGLVPVGITADGQLGVRASSKRFKEAIEPMADASEAILALHPVSFRYKKALDPKGQPEFGLVAEDVAKVDPDLVVWGADGKPFTVRYDAVDAMLLNEFLKAHHQVEVLTQNLVKQQDESKIAVAGQQKQIDDLKAGLKAQASLLQKVNEKFEMEKTEARVVHN